MTRFLSNLLFVFVAVLLLSCAEEREEVAEDLGRYYFDYETFNGPGMVYKYESVADEGLPPEYWHYRYSPNFRGNYLHAALYTSAGDLVQESVERLSRDGAQLLSLKLYYFDQDTVIPITASIENSLTFSFAPLDSMPRSNYRISYWDTSADSVRVILEKHRKVEGATEFVWNGEQMPAAEVATLEKLETETEGFTETQWSGREIYVQDLGLVYFRKEVNDNIRLEYTLSEIIPFEEFRDAFIIGRQ